jgi:hypothetical protein
MNDSPRIPYLLWPLAIMLAFTVAYTVDFIEKNWRPPQKRRSADWRAQTGEPGQDSLRFSHFESESASMKI